MRDAVTWFCRYSRFCLLDCDVFADQQEEGRDPEKGKGDLIVKEDQEIGQIGSKVYWCANNHWHHGGLQMPLPICTAERLLGRIGPASQVL